MIKSKYFWIAAIMIAIIPLLAIDVVQHNVDWQKEVREETIAVVQNLYSLDKQQKAKILDRIFERNEILTFQFYIKSLVILVLLGLAIYFFRLFSYQERPHFCKPLLYAISLTICLLMVKIFILNRINANSNIHFLELNHEETSFKKFHNDNFKGKVVYIDFWGTTCGPCLAEFRDFTKPLKVKYQFNQNISYLYIAHGNKYLWHEQIKKYNVEGHHLFLDEIQYNRLYKQTTNDSTVLMPHYLIVDRHGNVAVHDAKRPSNRDSLYRQLDKYLL